jgi:hypothetical protein
MVGEQVGTKIAYNIWDQGFGVKGRKLLIDKTLIQNPQKMNNLRPLTPKP